MPIQMASTWTLTTLSTQVLVLMLRIIFESETQIFHIYTYFWEKIILEIPRHFKAKFIKNDCKCLGEWGEVPRREWGRGSPSPRYKSFTKIRWGWCFRSFQVFYAGILFWRCQIFFWGCCILVSIFMLFLTKIKAAKGFGGEL